MAGAKPTLSRRETAAALSPSYSVEGIECTMRVEQPDGQLVSDVDGLGATGLSSPLEGKNECKRNVNSECPAPKSP